MGPGDDKPRARGAFVGEVLANERLCQDQVRLLLALEGFPPSRPGQFVQLQCRGLHEQLCAREVNWPAGKLPHFTQAELTDHEPLLRRPFSLAGRRRDADGRDVLTIIHRTVGTGTRWLAGVRAGQRLSVLGPLGNAFAIDADKPLAALVGGGVGIPPMLYLAEALTGAGKRAVAFSGARSASLLPVTLGDGAEVAADGRETLCVREFAACGIPSVIATDDGSLGRSGTISEAFRDWLNVRARDGGRLVVYACGPEPMARAVAETCLSRGVACQLALERNMACGMGTCQSCAVKVCDDSDAGWSYKLCCTDGPVFDARRLLW